MIYRYFISFCRANKLKVAILILSIGVYFALTVGLLALERSLPAVVSLPFKKIGVATIVQKSGVIPGQMSGVIFPHSNGPIYPAEVEKLSRLDFVENADTGLYFWYFGDVYKNVFGVDENGPVFSGLLKQNIETGKFLLARGNVLITRDFAEKNRLTLDDKISFDGDVFTVAGILRPNLSGNIIPADVYMALRDAQQLAAASPEMQKSYQLKDANFVNLVALNTDPAWSGDKEALIKALNGDYLVFSEKTFSDEITGQIAAISLLGRIMFAGLGVLVAVIFALLTVYNLKTREPEIAVLRMLGWSLRDLKAQFFAESAIILLCALTIGNVLGLAALGILARQQVTMELPWEFSARPHFLVQENAIDRTISANLPVHYDPALFLAVSLAFLVIFGAIYYFSFKRLNNIKPAKYLK